MKAEHRVQLPTPSTSKQSDGKIRKDTKPSNMTQHKTKWHNDTLVATINNKLRMTK